MQIFRVALASFTAIRTLVTRIVIFRRRFRAGAGTGAGARMARRAFGWCSTVAGASLAKTMLFELVQVLALEHSLAKNRPAFALQWWQSFIDCHRLSTLLFKRLI